MQDQENIEKENDHLMLLFEANFLLFLYLWENLNWINSKNQVYGRLTNPS